MRSRRRRSDREMTEMKSEVTVITPAYNAEAYVEKAIQSVLEQTIPCRMIVVNDASKDGTCLLVERYADLYPDRIFLLDNAENMGVAAARNLAIAHAGTEYIAYLDADDWWDSKKLEIQMDILHQTGADACFSGRELMSQDGKSTGKILQVQEQVDYQKLLRGNVISCSSVVMRRTDAVNYPMVHDELHEDYIVWLSMLRDGKQFVGVNQPLLKSRLGKGGKSRNKLKSARMTYGVYRYMGIGPVIAWYYLLCYAFAGIRKYI